MKTYFRPIMPFIMPGVVLAAVFCLTGKWPVFVNQTRFGAELSALSVIFPFLPYLLLGAGFLMAWRFNQTGMLLSAWLLGTTYWVLHQGWCTPIFENGTGLECQNTLICLLFGETALFSVWRWRRLPLKRTICWVLIVLFQTGLVVLLKYAIEGKSLPEGKIVSSPLLETALGLLAQLHSSFPFHFQPVSAVFFCAGMFLLISSIRKKDVLAAGLLGSLLSVFLGSGTTQTDASLSVFFSTSGLILVLATLESSFFMAYRDELTGLPSRRALNQTLSGLGRQYVIAMIDVDHFKKFNDTYGHKTGDQVLKLLSTHLERMSGGAKPFRYGGEEFAAVFPGKTVKEALPHLDACRKRLSETPFTVRRKTREKASSTQRGKSRTKTSRQVTVTISIGAAEPSSALNTPSRVISSADKALYRAKKAGRNCVKT